MPRSRSLPLLRGSAAAAFATFTALVSHVAAGGAMPSWLGMLTPALLSVLACLALAGRRLSLLRLSIAVAISQAFFHVLFAVGASIDAVMLFQPAAYGHTFHEHPALHAAHGSLMLLPDGTMWLGHVIAALVTIAAFYRGERAARTLGALARALRAWIRRRTAHLVPVLSGDARARPRTAAAHRILVRSQCPERSVRRRGPPLTVALV